MVKPIEDVRAISQIAYGFIASKALFVALDLDLFGHLHGRAKSLEVLAKATGVSPQRLRTLLTSLVSVGLVTRAEDSYANAPAGDRYLVRGAPAYFGEYYRFQINRQLYPALTCLDAGLAGNDAGLMFGGEEGLMADPRQAESFSRAQHAGSSGPALLLARGFDLSGRRRLLDVAGGTGAFSIALCQRNPELTAVILDFPNVVALASSFIAESGLSGRITTIGANALSVEWPGNQDIVLLSYLLSAVPEGDIDRLLAKGLASLAPGGLLIIHDFMLDDDQLGPDLAAHWFLLNLALNTTGISFSSAELSQRLALAGFAKVSARDHIHDITKLVIAEKALG